MSLSRLCPSRVSDSGDADSRVSDVSKLAVRLLAAATCAVAAVGTMAPVAGAAPGAVAGTRSLEVLWAEAHPAWLPVQNGTLTIGGTYTCTDPAGTSVPISFTSLQIMPTALPSGAGNLPCGPGVVGAYWELTSFPTADVHHGYVSVFVTFQGATVPPKQLTA
ncbi:hypothetical protein ACFZBU_12245 [Embleya sp. NPDC008237]|uniref:hypothetical protein n=1 Tax=Embleya sp. NPDC008237 TaxID=3363978 RepID=UPI0036E0B5B0